MSKRTASIQLTADNADIMDEEDTEMPGKFEQATEDQLQKRVIKKAIRRGGNKMDTDGEGSNSCGGIFAGLKGTLGSGKTASQSVLQSTNKTVSKPTMSPLNGEHLCHLKCLNVSFNDWIGLHVKKNPYIDLTPVFRDYEKHLKTIDTKYGDNEESCSQEEVTMTTDETESQQTDSTQESQSSIEDSQSTDYGPQQCSSITTDDEESSLLKMRTKLFYKKDNEFTELGVGTLQVQSSSKQTVRLLLRNDTSLGTVILNVRLSSEVPLSTNKNNVLMVCPPNPPLRKGEEPGGGAPVTYLIRVKTSKQAEELLTCIKDNTAAAQ